MSFIFIFFKAVAFIIANECGDAYQGRKCQDAGDMRDIFIYIYRIYHILSVKILQGFIEFIGHLILSLFRGLVKTNRQKVTSAPDNIKKDKKFKKIKKIEKIKKSY